MEQLPSGLNEDPLAESSPCRRCLYRLSEQAACVAFPAGIPADIRAGLVDHRQPYPGDGGFRFVPAHPGARRSAD